MIAVAEDYWAERIRVEGSGDYALERGDEGSLLVDEGSEPATDVAC